MADEWIVVEDKPKAEHYDKRAFHGKRKGFLRYLMPTIEATQRYKCPCQYWEDIHYTYYIFQIPEPYSSFRLEFGYPCPSCTTGTMYLNPYQGLDYFTSSPFWFLVPSGTKITYVIDTEIGHYVKP